MARDRERAIEAGCDDYDTKPVELARLLGKIEALLPPKAERPMPSPRDKDPAAPNQDQHKSKDKDRA